MNIEEQKILERCERLFMRYGAKSVTMDDVARELAISKKTLYQYFSSKDELVHKVTIFHFQHHEEVVNTICATSQDAISEMLQVTEWITQHLRDLNPSLIYDLSKYYPKSWQLFLDHRNTHVYNWMIENIRKGREQELYRDDFDESIIASIYISRLEMLVDPQVFNPEIYPLNHLMPQYIQYHIRGITTPKGIKKLEKIKTTIL
ncbi:MAG TPA: TetR/AcrR family transcriptional regulator [Chitinophagales bacterium]|nr:TetR/AcrR family transcriptional regulator [Chitinophagales bacterium]